ncbi:hypothetical protein BJY52DRAFT_1186156 [Lactarius psammicola]|nr:hypothetical protein BJY52DRAFT_1186156 [Lactarius psammicola]
MSEQAASDTPDAVNMRAREPYCDILAPSVLWCMGKRPLSVLLFFCPERPQKLVELTASFANAPGLGHRLLDICAEIEAEARPYATLDWIQLFPRISAGDSKRLILFFSTLNHAYAGALMIGPPLAGEPCAAFGLTMADFEDLYSREMITKDEFDWC